MTEKCKKFTDYYQDPVFKERHRKYISEKIECDCGRMVMRVAMAKHKRTGIHTRLVKEKKGNIENIEELVEKLVAEKFEKMQKNV